MTWPLISPTSLQAGEEDRKTHAPLVQAKENEFATVTETIETNLRQGDIRVEVDSTRGDLAETEHHCSGDQASFEWEEERNGFRGAPEEQSRRTQEQSVAEDIIFTVDEEVFVAGDSTGGRAHSSTAMQCFFLRGIA